MAHDPIFEKVLLSESPFLIKEEHFQRFDIPWHAHPEFELTYIEQGHGKLTAGDYTADLRGQELILLGPNLPHCWYGSDSQRPYMIYKFILPD